MDLACHLELSELRTSNHATNVGGCVASFAKHVAVGDGREMTENVTVTGRWRNKPESFLVPPLCCPLQALAAAASPHPRALVAAALLRCCVGHRAHEDGHRHCARHQAPSSDRAERARHPARGGRAQPSRWAAAGHALPARPTCANERPQPFAVLVKLQKLMNL